MAFPDPCSNASLSFKKNLPTTQQESRKQENSPAK